MKRITWNTDVFKNDYGNLPNQIDIYKLSPERSISTLSSSDYLATVPVRDGQYDDADESILKPRYHLVAKPVTPEEIVASFTYTFNGDNGTVEDFLSNITYTVTV